MLRVTSVLAKYDRVRTSLVADLNRHEDAFLLQAGRRRTCRRPGLCLSGICALCRDMKKVERFVVADCTASDVHLAFLSA